MIGIEEIALRLGNALLVGAVVGVERERRDRPAGLRTHLVVSLASAVFMLISVDFARFQHFRDNQLHAVDPSRIASYAVAGMGFLGAGTIIRSRAGVKGITTAATVWLVTALGLASGAGMFALAWAATVGAVFILVVVRVVERLIAAGRKGTARRRLRVELDAGPDRQRPLLDLVGESGWRLARESIDWHAESGRLIVGLEVLVPRGQDPAALLDRLARLPGVRRVRLGPAR